MEFLEFHKQMTKICKSWHQCDGCPFESIGLCPPILEESEAIKVEQIVEQWAKEHPPVTNGDKLKEIFGERMRVLNDDSAFYPLEYYGRIEKWLKQEYQPPKGEEV